MLPRSTTALGLGVALLATSSLFISRHVSASRRAARASTMLAAAVAQGDLVLHVPHAPGPITLDGDTDDPGWLRLPGPARTGDWVFKDGKAARPYSDARLVWSGDYLYLSLYASDQDIESHTDQPDQPIPLEDDAFRVVFWQGDVEYLFEVTPNALITDSIRRGDGAWDRTWSSGAHASREIDGSINTPKGKDEEWGIELAVPFESLGMRGERGENIGMSLGRCDIPKNAARICAGWGEGPGDPPQRGRGRIVLDAF
jgi:hypothetical protein